MKKIKNVVFTTLADADKLLNDGYVCISATGRIYGNYERKDEVEKIVGLGIYEMYYHQKAKDYLACYILYKSRLHKLGFERIENTLEQLGKNANKPKIAVVGYGNDNEFCYRHILSDFLQKNGIVVEELKNVDFEFQRRLWEQDKYKENGHFNLTDNFVQKTLQVWNWIYAKTLPKNPHYYSLRKDLGDDELYLKIATHIRYFGTINIFQGQVYRSLTLGNYSYWTCPCDIENKDVDLINRAEIKKN